MKATINGTTMWYEEFGTGPAVLLLHGFPFDRSIWKDHVQPLRSAGYRIIVPDLRGFGESKLTAGEYNINSFSDDIVDLLNYLGIGRAAIVSLSTGGLVLNDLLKRFPARVAAAVFIDTPGAKDDHARTRCLIALTTQLKAGYNRDEVIDALADALFTGPDSPTAEAVRLWMRNASDRMLEMVMQSLRDLRELELGGFQVAGMPVLRLRDWRSLAETGGREGLFDFLRRASRWQPFRHMSVGSC